MTRLPRLAVAALVFTTLGFGGCAVGRDDDGNSQYTGVSASVPASETTARDAGIVQWDVTPIGPGSYRISGIGPAGEHVGQMTIGWTADQSTIDLEESAGQFVMAADGTVMENTIEDAALVAFFEADARAELELQGFRLGPQCMMATQTVVTDCTKALMTGAPMDVLKCTQSIAAAMMACQGMGGGGMGPMGGMEGGMEGGGMEGGMQEGGMQEGGSGGYDDGYGSGGYDDGYGSGGYGTGGYNDDGYGTGGYNDDGYGTGGYNDDGYGTGGYNDDGYNDGGYNDDGYNDGGYNDGGYYDKGGPRVTAHPGVPDNALPSMTFGDGAAPSRLRVGTWDLDRKRKRR